MHNMLIPDTLFDYIMNSRGVSCFSLINLRSIKTKRMWNRKTKEERAAFSAMRSRVQKKVYHKIKDKFHEGTRRAKKEFWDNIDPEWKENHIKKMSLGMKKGWDSGDPNFGPRISNKENTKLFSKLVNGNKIIEKDLSRVNDYCGVLTSSQMAELNG